MAKNLLSLVRNVRTSGNLSNQASEGYVVAMQRTEAMVLSSPRHSMPTVPAQAGSCSASRALAISARKTLIQRGSWPFAGQIGSPILFGERDTYPTAKDDTGYAARPESLAGLPQGFVRG